jgi:hypothetical protein
MTKPGDSQTKKTLHELAKEFPEKTYKELEKLSESQKSQAELEPIEGEEQDNPTLWEIAKEHNVSYADAVPIQEDMRLKRDALKAACTLGEMRKDRTPLANMKKRAEEAEGELSIMKGIETNRVKEAQARCDHLQAELDRFKKENNECYNRIADLTESLESKDYFKDPDYKYLIEENRRLEAERNELLTDNKKLARQVEDKLDQLRKSGL